MEGRGGQGAGEIVAVALPVPVDSLFDYRLPAGASPAAPGCRVRVPFGRQCRVGVVAERRTRAERADLRRVEAVLDPAPVLSPDLMAVVRAEARAVLCPVGLALAAALPAGSTPKAPLRYALTPRGRAALAGGVLRAPARRLCERLAEGAAGPAALRRRHPAAPRLVRELLRDGVIARADASAPGGPAAPSERIARLAAGVDAEAACAGPLARAPAQAALLRALVESGPRPTVALGREDPRNPARLRALVARGLVEIASRPRRLDVLGAPLETPGRVDLTDDQRRVLAPVLDAVRAPRAERFLLHGVTGSGKTEVYLQAVAEALARGRQALVLVPEITLTHQIVARLRARFGDDLAVLHSGLSPAERWDQWRRLQRGEAPIAVGARSALFAPLERLGLIVIDEEHDAAYKNEEGFRYHARDLAARRAAAAGCPVLMGSATPAVETRFATDAGEIRRLVLPHRIGGRPLPAVELVDLERERAATPRGRKLILTQPLRRALRETLDEGGQALLLLNRRGFSTRIFCFDCGHAERCKHCDISLVFHAASGDLRCHYCDYKRAPPEVCSGCGAPDTALLGVGTERVEEELRIRFPEARVARLDRDVAARKHGTEQVLRALRDGEVDVVVGTQMVAKGHDFPGVRLVGVVLADLGLHLPDFRAAERTFQLLTQVAGRAGRGGSPGRVVVQTFLPAHYAIRPVRSHDYETFYREELAQRQPLGYPPFGRLAHALVSGTDEAATREAAERIATAVRAGAAPGVEVLGPAPAPLARLRDRFRFQILAKGRDPERVREVARALLDAGARPGGDLRVSVDANPMNML